MLLDITIWNIFGTTLGYCFSVRVLPYESLDFKSIILIVLGVKSKANVSCSACLEHDIEICTYYRLSEFIMDW